MSIVIKGAKVCDLNSPFNGKVVDIEINDAGHISHIGSFGKHNGRVIEADGKIISVGWFDMWANLNDPGLEHKEDLQSGLYAASCAGFTDLAVIPNTRPVIQHKNDIVYLKQKSSSSHTRLHPMAAVTMGAKGEELTEMLDLFDSGAVAFTDGEQPLWHTDVLGKALLYLQHFEGLLINKPEDKWLASSGVMHEGKASTLTGMKGIPSLAEALMIQRDLMILELMGGKIHFTGISSALSLQLIKEAKSKGLNVTCDVPIHQLILNDENLLDFDTNYKVKPPLRSESDRLALIKGVQDGTIDAIASHHSPQDIESKCLEFDLADYGMLGLATFLPNLLTLVSQIPLDLLISKVTSAPRNILNIEQETIDVGKKVCVTVFDQNKVWDYNDSTNYSKSNNSPWLGQRLTGKVAFSVIGTKIFQNA